MDKKGNYFKMIYEIIGKIFVYILIIIGVIFAFCLLPLFYEWVFESTKGDKISTKILKGFFRTLLFVVVTIILLSFLISLWEVLK